MNTKIYDQVLNILETKPETRSSDKCLIWEVLRVNQFLTYLGEYSLTYDKFMNAPSFESIRRCRQKIQETNPKLQATEAVKKFRSTKQAEKGTFIYREKVACIDPFTGERVFL